MNSSVLKLIVIFFAYITPNDINAKEKNNKKLPGKKIVSKNLDNLYPPKKLILDPVVRLTILFNDIKNKSTKTYHATGFSIGNSKNLTTSLIITNAHFCKKFRNETNSLMFAEDSSSFRGNLPPKVDYPAIIVRVSEQQDLCLVLAQGFITPIKMGKKNYIPKALDIVYTVGAPGGVFPIVTKTNVSTIVSKNNAALGPMSREGPKIGMLSAKVYPGQSGSPVYDKDGIVIGVLFSATGTYGGFFILNEDIYNFVE